MGQKPSLSGSAAWLRGGRAGEAVEAAPCPGQESALHHPAPAPREPRSHSWPLAWLPWVPGAHLVPLSATERRGDRMDGGVLWSEGQGRRSGGVPGSSCAHLPWAGKGVWGLQGVKLKGEGRVCPVAGGTWRAGNVEGGRLGGCKAHPSPGLGPHQALTAHHVLVCLDSPASQQP